MTGLVTLGETMGLFRAEHVGSLAQESEFRLAIGGAESNVAIGVARLGGAATWVGRVGDDGLGDRIARELRAEGVTARIAVDPDARTGLMLKERRTAEATRVTYYRSGSAGSRLTPADLPEADIRAAGVVHVTGITPALSATAQDAVFAAIEIATAAGVPVSFDVNHRSALWSAADAAPVYREIARRSSIVFGGDDELALIAGDGTPHELAARLSHDGDTDVVVKLGARGCVALISGESHTVPAIAVRPLDTVGAGDAFVAGYLAELLGGRPPRERLDTAVRTGAFACLGPGDWESYARRPDLGLLDGGDPVVR